jgi:hypothetical protein
VRLCYVVVFGNLAILTVSSSPTSSSEGGIGAPVGIFGSLLGDLFGLLVLGREKPRSSLLGAGSVMALIGGRGRLSIDLFGLLLIVPEKTFENEKVKQMANNNYTVNSRNYTNNVPPDRRP